MYTKDKGREEKGLPCTLSMSDSWLSRSRLLRIAQWLERSPDKTFVFGSSPNTMKRIWCPIPKSGNIDYSNIQHPTCRIAEYVPPTFGEPKGGDPEERKNILHPTKRTSTNHLLDFILFLLFFRSANTRIV